MESQAEPFVYKESFSNILPPKTNEILKVIVWTIIDGQLIAKSSVNYLNDEETKWVFNIIMIIGDIVKSYCG